MTINKQILSAACLIILCGAVEAQQNTAELTGTVTDSAGAFWSERADHGQAAFDRLDVEKVDTNSAGLILHSHSYH